jgi:hypothetical protein
MKPAIEKGEKCYNARLTAEQVHEARILCDERANRYVAANC